MSSPFSLVGDTFSATCWGRGDHRHDRPDAAGVTCFITLEPYRVMVNVRFRG
jgi:hypothetical protein